MLQLIRKYQYTLMLFVAVIVILAFSVWGGYTGGATPGSASMLRVYGRDYQRDDFQRLTQTRELAEMLGQFQFTTMLANIDPRFGDPQQRNTLDFVVNLIVMREEAPKLGIRVTGEEVREWVQSLPVFQTDGQFDPAKAQQVLRNLGAFGMGQRDINQLAVDVITLRRLTELVGSNISAAPELVDSWYAVRSHMLRAKVVELPFESFEEKVEATDEDIEAFFNANPNRFQRPELRALRYVHLALPAEIEELSAEERRTRRNQFSTEVHNLAVRLLESPARFDEIVTEAGHEVREVGLFAREEPPEELEGEDDFLREAFDLLFPEVLIGDPVRSLDRGYFLFKITELDEPEPRDLDEVRDEVAELVQQRLVREAAQDAAIDLRDRLSEGLEEGRDWSDLVADLEFEIVETGYFGLGQPPAELPSQLGARLAESAPYLPLRGLSLPLPTDEGYALAHVTYKELWQRPDSVQDRMWIADQLAFGESRSVLNAWFQQAKDRARPLPSEFVFGPPPPQPED